MCTLGADCVLLFPQTNRLKLEDIDHLFEGGGITGVVLKAKGDGPWSLAIMRGKGLVSERVSVLWMGLRRGRLGRAFRVLSQVESGGDEED